MNVTRDPEITMAYTLSDFLRTWTVTATNDLMDEYVNVGKTIQLYLQTSPDRIGCSTQASYSKQPTIDWEACHWTATVDPSDPPNIMLRSRASGPNDGGIDGNNVYFRITAAPGGGNGAIRCYMVTVPSGTWDGSEG
jgi:hypothetical protein